MGSDDTAKYASNGSNGNGSWGLNNFSATSRGRALNPYSGGKGSGITKPVQYVIAGVFFLLFICTVNLMSAGKENIPAATKANKKVDDDRFVRIPKNVYEKELGGAEGVKDLEDELKHGGPGGRHMRSKKNNELTFEQEDLMYLKDKLIKRTEEEQRPEVDLGKNLHKEGLYNQNTLPDNDPEMGKWVDGVIEKHRRTHKKKFKDGHVEEVRTMEDYDPNDPLEIPPRKHRFDNRWEKSENLPEWMKDYFFYHAESYDNLQANNFTNWQDYRYLVATCFSGETCGSVMHRIRPVPALIKAAADSKRLLLIYWELHPLQNYLEPPHHGGLNWKVPGLMHDELHKTAGKAYPTIESAAKAAKDTTPKSRIVSAIINDPLYGEPYYNGHLEVGDQPADRVFHDVFNVLFKQTVVLQERIRETHHVMGMDIGKYAAVHIDYKDPATTEAGKEILREKVENALNCVSNLRPGGPFLVAGESFDIVKAAIKYAKKHNVQVAARQVMHDSNKLPKDMFNAFLELYFMANANCVAYGNDGYGQLGYMMGYDHDCRIKYDYLDGARNCTWTDTKEQADEVKQMELEERQKDGEPLTMMFQPELGEDLYKSEDDGKDVIDITRKFKGSFLNASAPEIGMPIWMKQWLRSKGKDLVKDGPWYASKTMPKWMKAYLTWHKEVRANITATNWKDHHYVIMTCYTGQACGNVNNRLRPLPAHVRLAAINQRILMIHWDPPNKLEYFVEPPKSKGSFGEAERIVGINWAVPDFMLWKMRTAGQQVVSKILFKQARQLDRTIVNSQFNDDTYMEPYYDERLGTEIDTITNREEPEKPASQVFRDLFFSIFQPTLELEERVDEIMAHENLERGKYAVAHVAYPIIPENNEQEKEMVEHVENAINCLSHMSPEGPYVAFAETFQAAAAATAYGLKKGVNIPAKQISHDKHVIPKDVMGSFAEVMLMANANCVSYARGGFGELGYILGTNYDCRIKYAGKDKVEGCEWEGPRLAAKSA